MDVLRHYREVWAVDFEFTAPSGHRPTARCVVAGMVERAREQRRYALSGKSGRRAPLPMVGIRSRRGAQDEPRVKLLLDENLISHTWEH